MPEIQHKPDLADGWWYWVRYDDLEAPARYQANVDCFYSFDFWGIPASQVTVLGPALRAPATELTTDTLIKRLQASPFRDDIALAKLVVAQAEEIKTLKAAINSSNRQ